MKNILYLFIAALLISGNVKAQQGKVGINTTNPRAMLHVKDSSVLFTGALTIPSIPGQTPISGSGVRMLWYPDKAAFRAGEVLGNKWGRDSIGIYSFASGYNNVAFGPNSIAMGKGSKATGISTIAIGEGAVATGEYSTAIGFGANVSGDYSSALGFFTNASGSFAAALGDNTTAGAESTTAMGYNTVASSIYATAMGSNTTASGVNATSMGAYTKAKGNYSTAMGILTHSNGLAGLVVGMYNDTVVAVQQDATFDTPLFIVGNGNSNESRTNAMVVRKDGHVGIGTNIPLHTLHVNAETPNVQLSRFSAAGGYSEIVVDNTSHEVDFGIIEDEGYVGTKTAADFMIRAGSLTRMFFDHTNGNVGIGTINPSHKLEVNGSASKPNGGSWLATSDARVKQNVLDYTDGLSKLLKIRPVTYQYNSVSGYDTNKQHIGIIAQELQQVAPYMVSTSSKKAVDGTSNYLEVDNSAMVYMLINAVKEQQAIISQLEQRIVQLEAQ